MNHLKKILTDPNPDFPDKKRTTIYISKSVYKQFKKTLKKKRAGSVSGTVERFMTAVNEG
jgi:hypothetical protein